MVIRNRHKRIAMLMGFGSLFVIGAVLIFSVLKQNMQFFYDPSEVLAQGFVPASEDIRIGGLVVPGTFKSDDSLDVSFEIIDFVEGRTDYDFDVDSITVSYTGVLPDLFSEGEGTVVLGKLTGPNTFEAREVLAKHDENYQPVKNKSSEYNATSS